MRHDQTTVYTHVAFNRNYCVSLAFKAHMKFSQLISTISPSQRRMNEKLAQFQEEVRLGQVEVAPKALKKACCMLYSIHVLLVSFLGHLLAVLTW